MLLPMYRWRTKQNLDYTYSMMYARSRGTYYVQVLKPCIGVVQVHWVCRWPWSSVGNVDLLIHRVPVSFPGLGRVLFVKEFYLRCFHLTQLWWVDQVSTWFEGKTAREKLATPLYAEATGNRMSLTLFLPQQVLPLLLSIHSYMAGTNEARAVCSF